MGVLIEVATVVALLTAIVFLIYFLFVLRDARQFVRQASETLNRWDSALQQLQPKVEEVLVQMRQFFQRGEAVIHSVEEELARFRLALQEVSNLQQTLQQLNVLLQQYFVQPVREAGVVLRAAVKAGKAFVQMLWRTPAGKR